MNFVREIKTYLMKFGKYRIPLPGAAQCFVFTSRTLSEEKCIKASKAKASNPFRLLPYWIVSVDPGTKRRSLLAGGKDLYALMEGTTHCFSQGCFYFDWGYVVIDAVKVYCWDWARNLKNAISLTSFDSDLKWKIANGYDPLLRKWKTLFLRPEDIGQRMPDSPRRIRFPEAGFPGRSAAGTGNGYTAEYATAY